MERWEGGEGVCVCVLMNKEKYMYFMYEYDNAMCSSLYFFVLSLF